MTIQEMIGQILEINFEDGYLLRGQIENSDDRYVYTSELIMADDTVIGTYELYFQTESTNGVVIEDSMDAQYGNAVVNEIMNDSANKLKTNHETAKNSIGNIR